MRLITHNMLQCHVKNCNNNNFPLRFEEVQVELIEADFNPEFLSNMLNKIEWDALYNTAVQVNQIANLFYKCKSLMIIYIAWHQYPPCSNA